MQIWLKRAYEEPAKQDGCRVLVDRLWPRGVSKAEAAIDLWLKEIAPSDELRRWYNHEPEKWEEFRARYFSELDGRPEVVNELLEKSRESRITLVFSSREKTYNNAFALKEYLEKKQG